MDRVRVRVLRLVLGLALGSVSYLNKNILVVVVDSFGVALW